RTAGQAETGSGSPEPSASGQKASRGRKQCVPSSRLDEGRIPLRIALGSVETVSRKCCHFGSRLFSSCRVWAFRFLLAAQEEICRTRHSPRRASGVYRVRVRKPLA